MMMSRPSTCWCLVYLLSVAVPLQGDEVANRREFRVAGYLPDYRFAEFDLAAARGVTDLILFSAEPTAEGGLSTTRLDDCPWEKVLAFKTTERIRLWLTIGGWDRSTHFAEVATSPVQRQPFVQAIVRLALDRRLDGIDLDWEHPQTLAEQEAYGTLLADLRTAFKPHGLLLSVTIAAWQRLPQRAIESVAYVQVMAYDHEQEHSTLANAKRDLKTLREAQIPAEKIVLGLPFYGREVDTRTASSYREIITKHRPAAKVDRIGTLYFNGPETIRRKVRTARESLLGGVLIWELGQDATGEESLLKVILETAAERED
jgi:chitinase